MGIHNKYTKVDLQFQAYRALRPLWAFSPTKLFLLNLRIKIHPLDWFVRLLKWWAEAKTENNRASLELVPGKTQSWGGATLPIEEVSYKTLLVKSML